MNARRSTHVLCQLRARFYGATAALAFPKWGLKGAGTETVSAHTLCIHDNIANTKSVSPKTGKLLCEGNLRETAKLPYLSTIWPSQFDGQFIA